MARKLHRLQCFDYLGEHRYSFTLHTHHRQRHFCRDDIVQRLLQLLQCSQTDGIAIPAYCFMPDHLHLMLVGLRPDADARWWVSRFKQSSGYWFAVNNDGARLWQRYTWDRVLRAREPSEQLIRYIVMNPVKARLVNRALDYPYVGSFTISRSHLARITGDTQSRLGCVSSIARRD